MELSEEQLQELKENKIQFKDLDDRYFIGKIDDAVIVGTDNILKLLNEDICSFGEIVDKFKSIEDPDDDPSLYLLLQSKELFKELIENKKLNKDDLNYLLNKIDNKYELDHLSENTILVNYVVDKGSFKELVDKYKSIEDGDDDPCLYRLLYNDEIFNELIENNKLTNEDLRYLLNKIDRYDELFVLCRNTPLIKCILNEFVLDKTFVDRFNAMIEGSDLWYKTRDIHNVFEFIEFHATHYYDGDGDYYKNDEDNIDQEVLKLNEVNKYTCTLDFNKSQKAELYNILKNSENSRNTLKQIVDSSLQDTYDFETLKNLLSKDEEKKKIKINI